MTIEVERNGKYVKVNPNELTNLELCECLSNIQIESDEFLSKQEIDRIIQATQTQPSLVVAIVAKNLK